MLDRLMQRANQAEVFEVQSETTRIGFEANRLRSFQVRESQGVAVRVVVDRRLGFAASSDREATDRLVANALESARHGDVVSLQFPAPQPSPSPRVYDPALARLPTERLVEMGREMLAIMLEAEPDARANIDLERKVRQTTVRNSAGTECTVRKSSLLARVTAERARADDVVVVGGCFETAVIDEGYRTLADSLGKKLGLARRSVALTSGRMPVLFSPHGALPLALCITAGLNGKNIHCAVSPMTGRLGQQIFDQRLTVVDDPTLDGRPESSSYDDEGIPRRRRVLIDRGVLRGFIYDLKTAAQAGVEPTGHGVRSLFSPPSPSFSNLILLEGDTPLAGIIAGIKRGLLVEASLGVGRGNAMSGDFSSALGLAFQIEQGEIVGRVKDVSVDGNIYRDLRYVEALSQEAQWVRYGIRLPHVLLPELDVISGEGG